jgi:hypothetical protein
MSDNIITKYNEVSGVVKEGEKILEENDFFNGLENVMQNYEFRSFYNKYFKDSTDIKTVIMYMKLYETIELEYLERNSKPIEKELLAFMLRELINNNVTRKIILKSFENFNENNNKFINDKKHRFLLDIFENNIQKIKDIDNKKLIL